MMAVSHHDPIGDHLLVELTGTEAATAPAGAWWAGMAQLLASPHADGDLRAAALHAAAARDDAVAVLEVATDHTGRPGVTFRVPYTEAGSGPAAELTFDRDTGALLQRAVHTADGVVFTTYLETCHLAEGEPGGPCDQ